MDQAPVEDRPPRLPPRPAPPLPPRPNSYSNDTQVYGQPRNWSPSPGSHANSTRSQTQSSSGSSTRPSSIYPNAPIDSGCEIRIVQVLPGHYRDAVQCRFRPQAYVLRTADTEASETEEQSQFEALSYTWGGWDDFKTISLGNVTRFPVTQNLWAALRRLRSTKDIREMWIDQLSINQDDEAEKSKQVVIMGQIYRQADQVILWLGDVPLDNFASHTSSRSQLRADLKRTIEMTTSSWFTRAWVLQEFIMARRDPQVCFGPHAVMWTEFFTIALPESKSAIGLAGKSLAGGLFGGKKLLKFEIQLLTFSQMRRGPNERSLLTWAWTVSQLDCSIAKDKVYSLLAMLPPGERALLEVDYQKSDALVFAEATCTCIVNSNSLLILALAAHSSAAHETGLPSWIADFKRAWTAFAPERADEAIWSARIQDRLNRSLSPLLLMDKGKSLTELSTKSYSWSSQQPASQAQFTFDPDSLTLTITALKFDKIGYAAETNDYRSLETWTKLLSSARAMATEKWLPCQATVDTAYERLKAQHPDHKSSSPSSPRPPTYTTCAHCSTPLTLVTIHMHIQCWENATKPLIAQFEPNITAKFYKDNVHASDRMTPGSFVTASGLFGMGSQNMQAGDEIVLPYGSRFPMVLRRVASTVAGGEERWQFMGFVYVYGVMQGELGTKMPGHRFEERRYVLA